ncbi:TonB-dependent receptor [Sphingobium sp. RAC03]|uniref:TonB-dependent receptor n=1 Tax=Sphingobium sp. RAC03 TaxID=1843368 RepID=UPI00083DE40E|nr:TonB-dependent receptor [Sphingobium sp. RAC03]AOF94936.1 tonB dependent receptor family protein [Sphingobium sp. RAC03]
MHKLIFMLFLGTATPALAQANSAPSRAADTSTRDGTTNFAETDIVVTAQRRAERLQDVPVSVTAVTAEGLEARGISNLSQLSQAAPSLQVSGENNFTVRGVGTLAFQQGLESSVAIAQDEVNLVSSILGGAVGTFYDVAQVEVLSGPQGLLFGKNASAGLLNIVTRRPELGKLGGQVQVEGVHRPTSPNNGSGFIGQGTINVPIGEKSALRVNAVYSTQDPVVKFVGSGTGDFGQTQYGVRAKYLVEFSDVASLYIIGDYNEEHGIATYFDRPYANLAPNARPIAPLQAIGIVPGFDTLLIGGGGDFYRDVKRGGIQAKFSYELASGIEISNIAAWKAASRRQNFDTDYTNVNGLDINRSNTKYDQFTNELRVALPATDRFTGQFGLFYYQAKTKFDLALAGFNFVPVPALPNFPFCVGATNIGTGPGQCRRSNTAFLGQDGKFNLDSKSYAAFGQFTYEVVDNLKLIAGGRVTHDRLQADLAQHQGQYFVTLGVPLITSDKVSNTNFSYRIGAQYNFTPDIMLYGTFGRGYKGPGLSQNVPRVGVSPVVDPEINNNIEVGLKSTLLDRKLILNLAAFRSKFKNLQVSSFSPELGSTIVQNAASAKSQGIELSVNARPQRGLTFNLAATVLDSKFQDFPGTECYIGQPDASCNVPTGRQFNAGGLRTPASSKLVATAQAQYEWAVSGSLNAFVEGNILHRSSQWFTINQAPGTRLGGFETLGASIGLQSSGGWRASLFCRNCSDKFVPSSLSIDPGEANNGRLGTAFLTNFNSVRQIGVNFGFDF